MPDAVFLRDLRRRWRRIPDHLLVLQVRGTLLLGGDQAASTIAHALGYA